MSIKELITVLPTKRLLEVAEYRPDLIDWEYISRIAFKLPEEFINKYADYLDWYYILKNKPLSEEFLEEHIDNLNWDAVSKYQKLSEEFIDKYKDKVDWNNIFKYQTLSKKFIFKYSDKYKNEYIDNKYVYKV